MKHVSDVAPPSAGALADLRVLDLSEGLAGATAAMLLGDEGADVLRLDSAPPANGPPRTGAIAWHRNKTIAALDPGGEADLLRLIGRADVVVVDLPPVELARRGLDAATVLAGRDDLVHLWLPGYGITGRWSDLRPDPHLLAAACGVADAFSASVDQPVLPVVPVVAYEQGILGATAAMAAIVERDRTGSGRPVVVSGLHAAAAMVAVNLVDGPGFTRPLKATFSPLPHYRHYQCADGRWLYLAALSQPFFLRALEVLDLIEVMVLPGVDGEFLNLMRRDVAAPVIRRIASRFAEHDRAYWLDVLTAADVPNAPVEDRDTYLSSALAEELHLRQRMPHPTLGSVDVPNVPIRMSLTPGRVRIVPDPAHPVDPRSCWNDGRSPTGASRDPGRAASDRRALPLEGLRVLDVAAYIAGSFGPTILACLGADVVKVETHTGDPYRAFTLSFMAVNQGKRAVSLDLKNARGLAVLQRLAATCDVVVDNLRPSARHRLGLTEAVRAARSDVIFCSTSGFGDGGLLAESPGFDPLLQARSGLMLAQGGDGDPVFSSFPVHDIVAGSLGAFGTLCAVHHRSISGSGQGVHVSLAAASTMVQLGELASFPGSAPAPTGGVDWTGPDGAHRLYQCADGWIAIMADTDIERAALIRALRLDPEMPLGELLLTAAYGAATLAVGKALRDIGADQACQRLRQARVPAVVVLPRSRVFDDDWLAANDMFHVVDDPTLGSCTIVNSVVHLPGSPSGWEGRPAPAIGEHTVDVLRASGYDDEQIEELFRCGVIRVADQRVGATAAKR